MSNRIIALGFVIFVGILNIALNSWVKKAAEASSSFTEALLSHSFIIAFVIGLCSILCLLAVYSSKISLSSGILFMGATSIVGGSLYGVLVRGEKLPILEWIILVLIAVFYVSVWVRAIPSDGK